MDMKNRIPGFMLSQIQKLILFITVLAFGFASCTRHIYVHHKLPPGHAKKLTGAKSAKAYAPGRKKK
jgi:hypothetical protein